MHHRVSERFDPHDQGAWIERAGEAIAGKQWLTPFAEYLGVTPRTLANWHRASVVMNAVRWATVVDVLRESADEARSAGKQIELALVDEQPLDRAAFVNAAMQLYGPRWQTPIAGALDVSVRWIGYIATGRRDVPRSYFVCLAKRLADRADERDAIADAIDLHIDDEAA